MNEHVSQDHFAASAEADANPATAERQGWTPEQGQVAGNASPSEQANPRAPRRRRRKIVAAAVGLTIATAGGSYGYHWWTTARFIETTDDAYVKADIVTLSAQVAGTVSAIPVKDNQHVHKGDVLLRLDDSTYQAALDSARARIDRARAALANIEAERRLQQSRIASARADLSATRAKLSFARADYRRNRTLASKGTVAERQLDKAKMAFQTASAAVDKAQAAVASSRQQLDVLDSQKSQRMADLESATAARRVAEINIAHSVVRAPRDGVVGNRGVETGDYVGPGTKLMSLVPVREDYVVANFKETQIQAFRPRMKAEVSLDMLGGESFPARIESIAPASGSQFSILPAENATGNFTKIVQRVPVKIRFDHLPGAALAPRPGTSVVVSIDTKGIDTKGKGVGR